MKNLTRVFGIACGALLLVGSARADILYSNGPINGTITAWTINSASTAYQVADSFTLAADSTVTQADLGLWYLTGDTPFSVDWEIVGDPTNQAGTLIASGIGSALSNKDDGPAGITGYELWTSSFAIPSVDLTAGTYWLLLQNAMGTPATGGSPVPEGWWDENDGPSQAWESALGYLTSANNNCTVGPNCSETFDIVGTANAPEPGTFVLGGAGLLLAGILRRRRA